MFHFFIPKIFCFVRLNSIKRRDCFEKHNFNHKYHLPLYFYYASKYSMCFNVDVVLWSDAQRERDRENSFFLSRIFALSLRINYLLDVRKWQRRRCYFILSCFFSCVQFAHKQHSIRSEKRELQVCVSN